MPTRIETKRVVGRLLPVVLLMVNVTEIGAFIDSSPNPAWLTTDEGHCLYANPALQRLTGLKSEEVERADWRGFLHEEDQAIATASWQRSLSSGTPYRVRVRLRGFDDVSTTVEMTAFGHKVDEETQLWLFIASPIDAAHQDLSLLAAQLQATLNMIPAYAWYALPLGALTFVNQRTSDYLGLSKDHPLRFGIETNAAWDSHIPLLHPDDQEETRRVWSTCLRTGCAGQVSFRVRNSEGRYCWFLSRAEPLRASDGSLLYWIGVNLEIDDAKQAEDALSRSAKELRAVIDTIPAIVWCNLPDGPNEFLGKRWHEYTGMSQEESLGWGWQAAFHPDDLPPLMEKWQELLTSREPGEIEARIRRKDGVFRWFLVRVQPLCDGAGNVTRWYGTSTDIEDRKRAEQALQQSEFYLTEGQRLGHTGSWALNATGFEYWSSELFRIYGLDPSGKPPTVEEYLALVHPEDRAFIQQGISNMLADHRPSDFTKRIVRPDGEIRRVRCVGVPVTEGGTFRCFLGTAMDVTEQERLIGELRRSEYYLSEGQRLAAMGSWAFNPSGYFDYWSQELFAIYGLDPQKGAPTLEQYLATLHPLDRDSMADTIKRMHAEHCGCDVKKRIVLPNGEQRYIRCVGIPVVKDEVLTGFLGTAIDVTDQEKLTRELERRQTYLALAQRLSHTGSFGWQISTGAIYWSDETFRIFEMDPKTAPTLELILQRTHPDDWRLLRQAVESATLDKSDVDLEHRLIMPNGSIKFLRVLGHPSIDESGTLEYRGVVMDITDRKRSEEQRERVRQLEADLAHINRVSMLGEMGASLAHELKQPLAAAITSANTCIEWLAHAPPNLDRARAAAARVDKYGNRAAQIIDHIRSLYKKSASQRELVDVNGIVHEMFSLVEGEAARYSIAMHPELAAELPTIKADRVQLQQVFMNLMLNAIEAMQDSGGELTVRSQWQYGQLLCSVSDTGVGLPTENADQVFSAFFTTKPQGSGMGLAISRSIVESHGGRLWATANQGRGTTFHFTLPTELP